MSFDSASDIEHQSRSQIYPLFLFNLNCPRSLNDLTSGAFKDLCGNIRSRLVLLIRESLVFIVGTLQQLKSCRSFNSYDPDNVPANAIVNIIVKCSCGDSHVSKDYGQFITYPLRPDQNLVTVADEFNLPQKLLEDYNPEANFGRGSGLVCNILWFHFQFQNFLLYFT